MQAFKDIVREVLRTGTRKENRTGVDTISTFNLNYELFFTNQISRWGEGSLGGGSQYHCFRTGEDGVSEEALFPLLTTKDIRWKNIVVEMLWFLSGSTNVEFLRRHGCKFWDDWTDERGEVPSAYGNFWRSFPVPRAVDVPSGGSAELPFRIQTEVKVAFNDQVRWVLDEMRKNPMSRRLVVTAWAPENAQKSKLPPCHLLFVFNVQRDLRGKPRLCLHLTQRSCDVALGVPYNIASYALLLQLFCRFADLAPGVFAHTLVDAHIYTKKADGTMSEYDHVPGLGEQIRRPSRSPPVLRIDPSIRDLADVERLLDPSVSTEEILRLFAIEGYDPHPAIPFKVAV